MKLLILFSVAVLTGLAAVSCETNDTVIYHHYKEKEVPVYRTRYVEKSSPPAPAYQTTVPGSPQQIADPNTADKFRAVSP